MALLVFAGSLVEMAVVGLLFLTVLLIFLTACSVLFLSFLCSAGVFSGGVVVGGVIVPGCLCVCVVMLFVVFLVF